MLTLEDEENVGYQPHSLRHLPLFEPFSRLTVWAKFAHRRGRS